MKTRRQNFRPGLTFIEILLASAILLIAVLGASVFRYNAALGARKADIRSTAARTALLLCESWRGSSDPNNFAPEDTLGSQLTITDVDSGFSGPTGYTLLNSYTITNEGVNYYAILAWQDIAPGLRALNVTVMWNQRGSDADALGGPDKSYRLTTYISP
jgi:hypothetical protein